MARPRKEVQEVNQSDVEITDQSVGKTETIIQVSVYSPVDVIVTKSNGARVKLTAGLNYVDEDVADHWYAMAHGVRRA